MCLNVEAGVPEQNEPTIHTANSIDMPSCAHTSGVARLDLKHHQ